MELRGVGKVMFWWIRGWSLGRSKGLWCREFWRGDGVGFCCGFGWMEVNSEMVWSWNRGAEVLDVWVRLGGELGVIWRLVDALDCRGKEEEEGARFQQRKKRRSGGSLALNVLSLSNDGKAMEEEKIGGFKQLEDCSRACGI